MKLLFTSLRCWALPLLLALFACSTPHLTRAAAPGPGLSVSFSSIAAGTAVNLTSEGGIDWVHWGLYTETSLDRKSGVVPQISDFTLADAVAGFAFVYWFGDNANGYTWSNGTPTPGATNSTTGVWAYGTPQIGSGFQFTAPADTTPRILKVYVGAFGCRGRFEASLSDSSAPSYSNTSLFNAANGPSGAYTINYSAVSAGQHITIRWTLATPMRPDGNVTLQSAALTATNFNNPPVASLTSPANNADLSASANITLTATASDSDGSVSNVEFFSDGGKLGQDTTSPFSFTWNSVPAGRHVLTVRATDNQGASSDSSPVEIFATGTGGSLVGSRTLPPTLPTGVNLTSDGTRDWAHWGLARNSLFNHKSGVASQISNFTKIGTNSVEIYGDNYTGFSWSDGTPTAATNNLHHGVFATGVTNGFEFTVPADTTARTLKVYVGLYSAQASFQAWLSDFSAPAYTDTTLSNIFDNAYAVYSLTFAAASSGKTLHVRYRSLNLFDQDFGNVTLQAATLSGVGDTNIPPTAVTLISPRWVGTNFAFSFASLGGANYSVLYTPSLAPTNWQVLTNLRGNGSTLDVTNKNLSSATRFYRVESK